MKTLFTFLVGLLCGALVLAIAAALFMPKLMIRSQVSPFTLEETVQKLTASAEEAGWQISAVNRIDESVARHGGGSVRPVRVIKLCQPHYAARILNDPASRAMSVFMPCSISVFQADDGQILVSSMNTSLMGTLFGGTVAEVMAGPVAEDQQAFLQVLEPES